MQHSIFISDLHLCPTRPGINQTFFEFLRGPATQAEALSILGDLFEYWAGDDDDDPFHASVSTALRALHDGGVALYLMHGNRDFLIGERFTAAYGAQLLPDPTLLDLYGTRTLLMHGDTLCTDDVDYQRFRGEVRSAAWAIRFLATPLGVRKHRIEELRAQSEAQKQIKPAAIMDVNATAVAEAFRSHRLDRMIHGHTHRPAHHVHEVNGQTCQRWVLADWYATGSYLECNAQGWRSVALS